MSRTRTPKLVRKAIAKLARGTQPSREIYAHHEAAHAVVAWALGVRVVKVSLDTTDSALISSDMAAHTLRDDGTWIENAKIAIAGVIADQDFVEHGITLEYEHSGEEHGDIERCKAYLMHAAGMDVPAAKALLAGVLDEVTLSLERFRRPWHALAEQLCLRRELGTEQIERLLGGLPPVSEATLAERRAVGRQVRELYDRKGSDD